MSDNYAACPNHEGHWWHKSTGACSCGASHSLLDRLPKAGTTMSDTTPTHDEVLQFMSDLDNGTNLMGPLNADVRARLFAVVDKPNQETWADGHTIIISGITTLWQALLKHTDYDVTSGPSYAAGEAPGPWPKLPTSDQMLIAIRAELNRP